VIIGAGGLGLMCIAIHKAMGGKSAIVVDIDPKKREAAKAAGADLVFDGGTPDAAAQIVAATNGGAWAVIDLVGSSATARLGIDSLIKGGKYMAAISRCRCHRCRCARSPFRARMSAACQRCGN
jgi:threonine dehydrogenase-like Zn-dependent dehydrogenase